MPYTGTLEEAYQLNRNTAKLREEAARVDDGGVFLGMARKAFQPVTMRVDVDAGATAAGEEDEDHDKEDENHGKEEEDYDYDQEGGGGGKMHRVAVGGASVGYGCLVVCGGCGAMQGKDDGKALMQCGRCKAQGYCGRECQKAHREVHKGMCVEAS